MQKEKYFHGFCVKENARNEKFFITESYELIGAIDLYIDGEKAVTINYFASLVSPKGITEDEIWDYIYKSCKKHARGSIIYISQCFVDNVSYDPLVNLFA